MLLLEITKYILIKGDFPYIWGCLHWCLEILKFMADTGDMSWWAPGEEIVL